MIIQTTKTHKTNGAGQPVNSIDVTYITITNTSTSTSTSTITIIIFNIIISSSSSSIRTASGRTTTTIRRNRPGRTSPTAEAIINNSDK